MTRNSSPAVQGSSHGNGHTSSALGSLLLEIDNTNGQISRGYVCAMVLHYRLVIICPPAAVLACRRFDQLLLNVGLTLCLWIPGAIHALLIVQRHFEDIGATGLEQQIRQHRWNSICDARNSAAHGSLRDHVA